MDPIYLDNNATTRVAAEVFEAMLPYLVGYYGNPSSVHQLGSKSHVALKEAREKAARFLTCRESEITFTGCGLNDEIRPSSTRAAMPPQSIRRLFTLAIAVTRES